MRLSVDDSWRVAATRHDGPWCGYPARDWLPARPAATTESLLDARGLADHRRAVSTLAEMFHTGQLGRMSALGVAGSGKRVVVRELARCARARFADRLAPDRLAVCGPGARTACSRRRRRRRRPRGAFLDAALGGQPHVFLVVGEDEVRSIGGVAIGRVRRTRSCRRSARER
jgi:hypothetical protein